MWGAFWSWEPVQVLSVLAWLLYAVLLQTRSAGWRGRRAATLTIVGFALLIVSFLSLNLGFTHGEIVRLMQHEVLIVGLNHRTASVEVRERRGLRRRAARRRQPPPARLDGVDEAAVVCTCNRVEVVSCTRSGPAAAERIADFLRIEQGEQARDLAPHLYNFCGRDAVRHLFRVASSLDSMVVGEPQILGQLKEFYARAASVGATGAVLHRWFHKAFSVAKRVRTETGIAGRAVSVSSAAVELARTIFDQLEDKTAMLIGAGKMGELAARHLLRQRRRRPDRHQPHLRARRRAGARVPGHAGAVRAVSEVPADGRHRHRLDRRDRLRAHRAAGRTRRCASARGGRSSAST